jgi:RNA polymerase sigma factor (sigma-70 family)
MTPARAFDPRGAHPMEDRAEDRPGVQSGDDVVNVRGDDPNLRGLHANVSNVTGTREGLTPTRPTSPPLASARPEAALTELADEQLVALAAKCGHLPARDELIRRSLPLTEWLIRRHAARSGLQEADRQDAQQDAVLWLVEAIGHYRAEEQAKPGGCQFRSFLYRVLAARFIDFLRRRRRLRSHFPQAGAEPAGPAQGGDGRHPGDRAGPPGGGSADPVRGAEEGELRARLLGELARLGGPAHGLWELLAGGASLREVARVLNLSYDAVKRRRRKLFAQLRASLGAGHGA